jgi:ferredoxin--NADP+ reductase
MEHRMTEPDPGRSPLRIAVVGSGPAGFYTVQALLREAPGLIEIDMFDRLPAPFGLVRYGVAPDHPKIKNVTAVYDKLARDPRFRFFGNVQYGVDLRRDDLERFYHQSVFATGAQSDRRLAIPGEDLIGSHPATDFVAWFNGHPDFVDHQFELDCRRAVVIGVGNVAVDVARILCRTPEELASTDIADHALERLRASRIRRVELLGRRGPIQAKFTTPEVRELGELADTDASTLPSETELDPLTRELLESDGDKATRRKLEILQDWSTRPRTGKGRRLRLRFLVSPTEILGDDSGRVRGVRLVRNKLIRDDSGSLRAVGTGEVENLECGIVFRSVGYRGVAVPDLPFDDRDGVLPNVNGRIVDPSTSSPVRGFYASGWIKRGPSGIIGTNKPDALETVRSMLEDLREGRPGPDRRPGRETLESVFRERAVRYVSYPEWLELDRIELARGQASGRPRVKFVDREAMFKALEGGSGD